MAWVQLCTELKDEYRLMLLDEEYGLGIIAPKELSQRGAGSDIEAIPEDLTWEWFDSVRDDLLHPFEAVREDLCLDA